MNKARREFTVKKKKLIHASQRLFNRTMDDGVPPNMDSRTFSNDLGNTLFGRSLTPISRLIHIQKMTLRLLLSRLIHFRKMTLRLLFLIKRIDFQKMTFCLRLLFLMRLCHHSLLLRCYQFEMLNSLSRTPPSNPALCDPMPSTLVSKCEDLPVLTKS